MKNFTCVQDWVAEGVTFFKEGYEYGGSYYNEGKSVMMFGENGIMINFKIDNDYFEKTVVISEDIQELATV